MAGTLACEPITDHTDVVLSADFSPDDNLRLGPSVCGTLGRVNLYLILSMEIQMDFAVSHTLQVDPTSRQGLQTARSWSGTR